MTLDSKKVSINRNSFSSTSRTVWSYWKAYVGAVQFCCCYLLNVSIKKKKSNLNAAIVLDRGKKVLL